MVGFLTAFATCMLRQGCTHSNSLCSTAAMTVLPPPASAPGGTHNAKGSSERTSAHSFARRAGTRVKGSSWMIAGILLLSCGTISTSDAFSVTPPLRQGGRSMLSPGGDARCGVGGVAARSFMQVGMQQQQQRWQSHWTGARSGGVVGSATSSLQGR